MARAGERYFVMLAGEPKKVGSRFGVVQAPTARHAHLSIEAHYRQAEGLAPSVFVQTERLHDTDSKEEAMEFMRRLEEAANA